MWLYDPIEEENGRRESLDDGQNVDRILEQGIEEWLKSYASVWKEGIKDKNFLLFWINDSEDKEKRVLTKEAVVFTLWMKRCTEAEG